MNGVIILFDKGVLVHYASLDMVCVLFVYTTVADLVILTSMCQVRQYLYTMSTSFWSLEGTIATRAKSSAKEGLPTLVQMTHAPRLLSSRVFNSSLIYKILTTRHDATLSNAFHDNNGFRRHSAYPHFRRKIFVSWTQYTQEFAWYA